DHVAAAVAQMAVLDGPAYIRLAISAYNTEARALRENPETLTRQYAVRIDPRAASATIVGVGHGVQIALRALSSGELGNVDVFGVARFPWNPQSDTAL